MREDTSAFRLWMEALPEALKLPAGVFMPQEEWAWERIARGEFADMALFDPTADRTAPDWWRTCTKFGARQPDPTNPASFDEHHVLSQQFLRALVSSPPVNAGFHKPDTMICNAHIKDLVYLDDVYSNCGLRFNFCRFEQGGDFNRLTVLGKMQLTGVVSKGPIRASSMSIDGDLVLSFGCSSQGRISPTGETRLSVIPFIAEGEVIIRDAIIGGAVIMNKASFLSGLVADRMKTGRSLMCDHGFCLKGDMRLIAAEIGGSVAFGLGSVTGALEADRVKVTSELRLGNNFSVGKDVRLSGAKFGGDIIFSGVNIKSSLIADGIETPANLYLDRGFKVEGEAQIVDAKIGGSLSFREASLMGTLNAERIEAGREVHLRQMRRLGATNLSGAKVSGNLQLSGSSIHGEINLTGARIEGALELSQTAGSEPTWGEDAGLILRNVTCGALAGSLAAFRRVREGKAKKEHFPKLDLVGLRYANLGGLQAKQKDTLAGVTDANELIAFLEAGAGEGATFTPGPYQQLARELRDTGHESMADKIMIAMKRHERVCSPHWRKIGLCFADEFSRFGYCNHRALAWFGFVVMGSCAVGLCLNGAVFTPTAEGWDNFVGWFWFALGNAIPLITLDDAHRTFLAEQFRTAPNAVPWGVASVFHIAKIFGFAILSYYVASLAGLANPRNE